MSLTYGFYNSLNHDRKYNTTHLSRIFDGIIKDGIFMSIGDCFAVTAGTGMSVNVGTGKAWFNHTWTENDAILPVPAYESEVVLNRIDSLVLEVDSTDVVRANSIKFIKGTPASTPVAPSLTNTDRIHQYLLCTVDIAAGVTAITGSMIHSNIGIGDTPFVTGILETVDLNILLGQWQSSLNEFVSNETSEFLSWFDAMKGQLTTDAAGNLQTQVDNLNTTKLSNTSSTNTNVVTFTEASAVTNIVSGETHTTIFGKIKKLITMLTRIFTTYTVALPTTGWQTESGGYYKTVPLVGLLATDKPFWSMRSATNYPTTAEDANWKLLKSITCANDAITFHAPTVPSAAMNIEIRFWGW